MRHGSYWRQYGWFTEGFTSPVLQDAKALLNTDLSRLGLHPSVAGRGQQRRRFRFSSEAVACLRCPEGQLWGITRRRHPSI